MRAQTLPVQSKSEMPALQNIVVPLDFSSPPNITVGSENLAQTAAERMSMTARLARHPFFAGMNRSQLAMLADSAGVVQFQEGRVIFREGEVADRFYLIETGKVNLESSCGLGDPMLGWSWMFPPHLRTCTARTVEPTTAISLDAAVLLEYCEQDPSFGYQFLKRLNLVMYQWMQARRNKRLAIHRRDTVRQGAVSAAYGGVRSVGPNGRRSLKNSVLINGEPAVENSKFPGNCTSDTGQRLAHYLMRLPSPVCRNAWRIQLARNKGSNP